MRCSLARAGDHGTVHFVPDLLTLAIHLLVTVAKVLRPLFRFHRWLANLRVLEIDEIKSVPYAPVSHPFVERLIGTIRREYLDLERGRLRENWESSEIITTPIAYIARSPAPRRRNVPAYPHLLLLHLIITLGGSTVAVYSRRRWQRNYEFAAHKLDQILRPEELTRPQPLPGARE